MVPKESDVSFYLKKKKKTCHQKTCKFKVQVLVPQNELLGKNLKNQTVVYGVFY